MIAGKVGEEFEGSVEDKLVLEEDDAVALSEETAFSAQDAMPASQQARLEPGAAPSVESDEAFDSAAAEFYLDDADQPAKPGG